MGDERRAHHRASTYLQKPKARMGLVLPLTRDDRQITLFGKTNRNPALRNEVLAHEHVHFLQNRQDSNRSKKLHNPHQILPAERAEDQFVLYLLECAEVEARLHELVLSYYRSKCVLPQTLGEFLGMLADWDEMGAYLVQMTADVGLTMPSSGKPFAMRSTMFSGQLAAVLGILKDPEMTKRFVCEVLPVMYANLLHYYGDASASAKFAAQYARPNLYDALYRAGATGLIRFMLHRGLRASRQQTCFLHAKDASQRTPDTRYFRGR
ncbi:hypothetical protein LP420_22370 [Massilia sp. B-10]|nr:hypothetical protein LP420_22370 [Massilia sp. B-10]